MDISIDIESLPDKYRPLSKRSIIFIYKEARLRFKEAIKDEQFRKDVYAYIKIIQPPKPAFAWGVLYPKDEGVLWHLIMALESDSKIIADLTVPGNLESEDDMEKIASYNFINGHNLR